MQIERIDSFAVRIPRDHSAREGGAGSPAALVNAAERYSLARHYGTVYARDIETFVVKLTTTDGAIGWGEAQAPVAPEVVQEIVDTLLTPLIFRTIVNSPRSARDMLYDAMRVRGHFGGFYVDAITAIDCALWDLAGKMTGKSVGQMLSSSPKTQIPVYVSGLTGKTHNAQMESFDRFVQSGAGALKLFMGADEQDLVRLVKEIRGRSTLRLFVDALWRLDFASARTLTQELEMYDIGWLEAPFVPEDVESHRKLAQATPVRIAIGESYRTQWEIKPFLDARAFHVWQPDLGRCGISEAHRMAAETEREGVRIAPHVSVGMGPQIAAAYHCAAAWNALEILECNPQVYELAERFQEERFVRSMNSIDVPTTPGLGITMNEDELRKVSRVRTATSHTSLHSEIS